MVVLIKVMRFLGIWKTMDMPCIKVKKSARVGWEKGNILRNLSVLAQKRICKSGKRTALIAMGKDGLHIKTVFSTMKRMFGREYVYSVRLKNMIQEMMLKASLYNKIISI
jgi:hypothetical protein